MAHLHRPAVSVLKSPLIAVLRSMWSSCTPRAHGTEQVELFLSRSKRSRAHFCFLGAHSPGKQLLLCSSSCSMCPQKAADRWAPLYLLRGNSRSMCSILHALGKQLLCVLQQNSKENGFIFSTPSALVQQLIHVLVLPICLREAASPCTSAELLYDIHVFKCALWCGHSGFGLHPQFSLCYAMSSEKAGAAFALHQWLCSTCSRRAAPRAPTKQLLYVLCSLCSMCSVRARSLEKAAGPLAPLHLLRRSSCSMCSSRDAGCAPRK